MKKSKRIKIRNTFFSLLLVLSMAASPFINISGAMANDDVFNSITTTNKDKLNETGIMTDVVTGSAISISNDNVICENEQYNITFKVDSKWSGVFNGNISIKNVGDQDIENWSLKMEFPHVIMGIWDAKFEAQNDNKYLIQNVGYNQDILVGETISFGFTAVCYDEIIAPSKCFIPLSEEIVGSNTYTVEYQVYSDWQSGFNAAIVITNTSENVIEDWVLDFDFAATIDSFWTAKILHHEDNHYKIKNAGYNANIDPGQSITLGFGGSPGNMQEEPSNYVLIEQGKETKTDEINYEIDTDGDGIPDDIEKMLGTNPNSIDTDNDELSDYQEVVNLGTNPLLVDSDGNGISDAEEDFDNDNLSNILELTMNGYPFISDTDGDGLIDGIEFSIGTQIITVDTDNDGLSDGKEIELGTDPLVADTDGDGILDGQEKFDVVFLPENYEVDELVQPTINMVADISCIESFGMELVNNYKDTFFTDNMPGYMGQAYDFTTQGDFDSATLTFEFDECFWDIEDFEPAIYYYNEEEQLLEELDGQIVSGNTVTVSLEHYSKYILLNKTEYDKVWERDIKLLSGSGTTSNSIDIAFVLDSSGSMTSNDRASLRKFLSKVLISRLGDEDRVAVIDFDSSAKVLCDFTYDKDKAANAIDKVDSSGGTSIYSGISKALSCYTSLNETRNRIMIVLTDGSDGYSYNYTSLLKSVTDNNIIIYTIGLGNSVDKLKLDSIATTTNGKYYHAINASELEEQFDKFQDEIDYLKDSDGIPDYWEINLRLGNGTYIVTDPCNPDTDGDGIKDGDEIECRLRTKNGKLVYFIRHSDPTLADTDFDGYSDYDEINIYNTNPIKSNRIYSPDAFDFLLDNNNYQSNNVRKSYLEDVTFQWAVWVMNNIGGSYSKQNTYGEAIVSYFSTFGPEMESLKRKYIMIETGMEFISELNDEISDKAKIVALGIDFKEKSIEEVSKLLKPELVYKKEIEVLHSTMDNLFDDAHLLKDSDFDELFYDISDRIVDLSKKSRRSASINKKFKKIKGINTVFGFTLNALSYGSEAYEDLIYYRNIQSSIDVMEDNMYILELLSENSLDADMRTVAKRLLEVCNNEKDALGLVAKDCIQQTLGMGLEQLAGFIAGNLSPQAFAVNLGRELGVTIVNILLPMKDAGRLAYCTVALADAAYEMQYDLIVDVKGYSQQFTKDQRKIYVEYENQYDLLYRFTNLTNMRACAENKVIDYCNLESILDKVDNLDKINISACKIRIKLINEYKNYNFRFLG